MIDSLCQRYGCLPSALLAEDADMLIRMHRALNLTQSEGPESVPMEIELAGLSRSL